jgi:hypothetical protein
MQGDIIATLERTIRLQQIVGNAGVLKAETQLQRSRRQSHARRRVTGVWGGARRGLDFEAKRASSGTAEQKGAKGELLSELICTSGHLPN